MNTITQVLEIGYKSITFDFWEYGSNIHLALLLFGSTLVLKIRLRSLAYELQVSTINCKAWRHGANNTMSSAYTRIPVKR